jgi:hypothetical protein
MLAAPPQGSSSPSKRRTVWSGVYTAAQAKRGATAYVAECSRCHGDDLERYSGLRGARFVDNWREDDLGSLWVRIAKTMPVGAPGTLSESMYLDILAFILEANEFPAGDQELTLKSVMDVRFEGKTGPEPPPDFALVQTVGCLARDAQGTWRLVAASDPVRTREPGESTGGTEAAGGKKTFRILDASALKAPVHEGRKARVKGFLIRKQDEDRLNPTSFQVLAPMCP